MSKLKIKHATVSFHTDEGDDDQENPNNSRRRKSNKACQNNNETSGAAPASYSVEVETKHFMPLIPNDDQRPENFVCSELPVQNTITIRHI